MLSKSKFVFVAWIFSNMDMFIIELQLRENERALGDEGSFCCCNWADTCGLNGDELFELVRLNGSYVSFAVDEEEEEEEGEIVDIVSFPFIAYSCCSLMVWLMSLVWFGDWLEAPSIINEM